LNKGDKKRIALLIEYDGTNLVGWQKQNNGNSVQGEIEKAAKVLFKMDCDIQAAGRTDAGVHALGQVGHMDIPIENKLSKKNNFYLVSAFNALLKKTNIKVRSIQNCSFEFNARFSATKRFYLYKFLSRSAPPTLLKNKVWHIRRKIDIKSMKKASNFLIGHHDFTSFRSISCQASSPLRTIDKINFDINDDLIEMRIEAKSFLQNQVRIIAGSLIKVGSNIWKPEIISNILESKSRNLAGETAPACGLYLEKVSYPEKLLKTIWDSHFN
jgi:pseudouridylate synthase I